MRPIALIAALALAAAPPVPAGDEKRPADPAPRFESQIRPILKAHCFHCHGEEGKPKGKLDVRLRRLIVEGGKTGPSVVPGARDKSPLYTRMRAHEMPPEEAAKRPTPAEIELVGRWIDAGAPTARPEPAGPPSDHDFTEEERSFWSFQPIVRPPVPKVDDPRARSDVDRFLLDALRRKGLAFSPDADRLTLLRRATFDLTGLPPTPDETAIFLADDAPDAYERLVDRLLASPRYGERWGRHWLDVAGYSDSEGCDAKDVERKWAWRYRDYVVRSLNADKPFDLFVREQLAGDEMGGGLERLAATGYLRMAPDGTATAEDPLTARNDVVADTIKVVSTGLLGLTVGCAQCHTHRYDPITHVDYHRLRAIFEPALDPSNWRTPPQRLVSLYTPEQRAEAERIEAEAKAVEKERDRVQAEAIQAQVEKELLKVPEELREPLRAAQAVDPKKRTPEQAALLKAHPTVNVSAGSLYLYDKKKADEIKKIGERAAELRKSKPPEEFIRALTEISGQVPQTRLFHRGDPKQAKEPVAPGVLSVLPGAEIPVDDPALPSTGRRLAFANWLVDVRNPLVARVIVNRVWMHHFGRGLVGTPADFGLLGEAPSNPALLDWLAADFRENGWTLKRLHRLLMASTAYRQASRRTSVGEAADPDNALLWRMNVRRLEAEAIRDAMLAVSGALNPKMFGPPVPVMADEVGQIVVGKENLDGEGKVGKPIPLEGEEFRRSVYVLSRRSRPLSMLECFDAPVMEPNCEARSVSTVAPQALLLMNNGFVLEQADRLAARLRREAGDDPAALAARAWMLAYARPPREEELKKAVAFLARMSPARLGQALLTSNEFLYVD